MAAYKKWLEPHDRAVYYKLQYVPEPSVDEKVPLTSQTNFTTPSLQQITR